MKRIQTFINACLRRILKIRWPDIISNQDLWKRTRQQFIEVDIFQRSATPFGSLHLTSQGKPSTRTLRAKGRGADQETHGDVT